MYLAYCTKCNPKVALAVAPSLPKDRKTEKGKKIRATVPSHAPQGVKHEGKWKDVGNVKRGPKETPQEFLDRLLKKV